MAKRHPKAARLSSGLYRWRGRAVRFGKLPKGEQHRFRSLWSTKAAKTVRRAKLAAEKTRRFAKEGIVVTFRPKHKVKGETIPAAFMADKLPGQDPRDIVAAIREATREKALGGKVRGCWQVNIEWPDDDRGEPSEPYETVASLGMQELDDNVEGDAVDWIDEIEEDGQLFLRDKQKSGAKGTSDVTMIQFAVFYGL